MIKMIYFMGVDSYQGELKGYQKKLAILVISNHYHLKLI